MINPMDLSGRTILVTGASAGIGQETCILLSKLGARVILVARSMERLQETLKQMEGDGHRLESFDLTAIDEIPKWLKGITAETGPLHGLVHSAGTSKMVPVRLMKPQVMEEIMQINLNAAMFLVKALRQKGCYEHGSSVVFLSSSAGLVGPAGVSAYAASKGAIIAMTRSMATELVRDGIRVNCIAPGFVKTNLYDLYKENVSDEGLAATESAFPMGFGTTLDIAHAVAFLLAETGRWITGTTLVVDGGYTAKG